MRYGGIFVAASLVALFKRDIIKNKLFEQPFNNRIDSLRAEFNTLIQGNPIEPELLGYVAVNQFSSIYEVIDEIQNLSKSSLLNPSDREKVEKLLEQIKAYVVFPNSETLKKIKDTQGELSLICQDQLRSVLASLEHQIKESTTFQPGPDTFYKAITQNAMLILPLSQGLVRIIMMMNTIIMMVNSVARKNFTSPQIVTKCSRTIKYLCFSHRISI